jgi:hypothetical protein
VRKIFAWLLLLFLFLPGTARAQTAEKTLHLERGRWLWTLLRDEGCTKPETVKLWPKVAEDNGLDPKKDTVWQPQTLILKRDCRGEFLEVIALRKQVLEFPDKLQELQDKAGKKLAAELAKKDAEIARLWLNTITGAIALMVLGLAAGLGMGWILWGRRVPAVEPAPVLDPNEFTVEDKWGNQWRFVRKGDGYECPGWDGHHCGIIVGNKAEAQKHVNDEHGDDGQFEWGKPGDDPSHTQRVRRDK